MNNEETGVRLAAKAAKDFRTIALWSYPNLTVKDANDALLVARNLRRFGGRKGRRIALEIENALNRNSKRGTTPSGP